MAASTKEQRVLQSLAQHYGVQTTYLDVTGKRHRASETAIFEVLKALGAPVATMADLPDALRLKLKHVIERRIEPVAVAWNGNVSGMLFYAPRSIQSLGMEMRLQFESGENRTWSCNLSDFKPMHYENCDGLTYVARGLCVPEVLPSGYHQLTIESSEGKFSTKIISAPERSFSIQKGGMWGVFIPLYSLYSQRSLGAGDFGDMGDLHGWLDGLGGNFVATLPFMAAFLDKPFEPGPYSPASRLFWNEFYINLEKIPELEKSPEARALLESIRRELEDLRSSNLIEYRRIMAAKRKVLEVLSKCISGPANRLRASFEKYRKENRVLEDYATFRAAGEMFRKPWPQWPDAQREGKLGRGDFNASARDYHLYAQWTASRQIRDLAAIAEKSGPGLYLDLPLGIHPHSYDTWRYRNLFPEHVSGGAPPDLVFTGGQDWGFPPLHPEKIREDGYKYVIAYLNKIMRQAGTLRIDHVPGLHRIYWIPEGLDASQGVFVRYNADEIYAVLSLESNRNKCLVVGENLGTVPRYVNYAMGRHNVYKMYVVQYELEANDEKVLKPPPSRSIACLNTHDMSPFAGFLEGTDIRDRHDAGILDETRAEQKRRKTILGNLEEFFIRKGLMDAPGPKEAMTLAALCYLAMSPAQLVLVNLEDLWMEKEAQNLPGTVGDRPNWRRRSRHSLEEFTTMPEVVEILKRIDALRKSRK
jgi:4-alpha-glucanotransferase